jgi:hypothetical protein
MYNPLNSKRPKKMMGGSIQNAHHEFNEKIGEHMKKIVEPNLNCIRPKRRI